MRTLFSIIVFIHGLIHVAWFVKAFNLATISNLHHDISKINGILWLVSAVLFTAGGVLSYLKKDIWWIVVLGAVFLSQYLVIQTWTDSWYGTIVNGILLVATLIGYGSWNFKNQYRSEVRYGFTGKFASPPETLTDDDINSLPFPVKNYLRYTGAVGKPKIHNFSVEFTGELRQTEESEWMPFTSQQFNFVSPVTRLFFMNAVMKRLTVSGFHCFKEGRAVMDIRLLSLFNVQYQSGKEMDISETVTFFNDMVVMAPATLIDNRIRWIETNDKTVDAAFTHNNITILARLYFNEKGELLNFTTDDRYASLEDGKMAKARWSTPVSKYKQMAGRRLATYAETIYSYPEGDFCYGRFKLTGVRYNVDTMN